jgi:hypothetical protein
MILYQTKAACWLGRPETDRERQPAGHTKHRHLEIPDPKTINGCFNGQGLAPFVGFQQLAKFSRRQTHCAVFEYESFDAANVAFALHKNAGCAGGKRKGVCRFGARGKRLQKIF